MRKTPSDIQAMKGSAAIVCLTAYSAPMAELLDTHCDLLLVGDSLGMVLYGMDSTNGVDLEMMVRHGQAVMRRATQACVVVDMPFGSYEDSVEQALESARYLMDETGCDAVKLEGGAAMADRVEALVAAGVPVMGHIGLLPQSAEAEGGYKIKGKTEEQAVALIADAKALEQAGVFAIVIEGTIEAVAREIAGAVSVPTIGIGASAACDGQILVSEDMLGMLPEKPPKFVKGYADLKGGIAGAVAAYANEVRARVFPSDEYVY